MESLADLLLFIECVYVYYLLHMYICSASLYFHNYLSLAVCWDLHFLTLRCLSAQLTSTESTYELSCMSTQK